jgi:hypothetical protein
MPDPQSLAEVSVRSLNQPLARAQAEERLAGGRFRRDIIAARRDDVFRQDENGRMPHLPQSLN